MVSEQGQDNADNSGGQRPHPRYAPWVVLTVWLSIDLAVAAYYGLRNWGPGGTLTSLALYLGFGANAVALAGWATVWLTLSSASIVARLVYFLIALGGLLIAMLVGQDGPGETREFIPEFAKLIVGVATPLALMRRRGWRIIARQQSSREYGDAYVRGYHFSYSILDLLILTTGIGAFGGLLLADRQVGIVGDLVVSSLFVSAVVVPGIIAFSLDVRWLVAGTCIAPLALVAISWMSWAGHSAVLVLVCGAGLCLPIAILALRKCGYRLARIN